MPFKINISHKGRTAKIETESESLVRSKIGDKIKGESFSPEFEGYELVITGASDISGFPGIKGQSGARLRRVLLTREAKGMNDKRKGLRLKKSIRGEEISEKTSQINMKVLKEGHKKFAELLPKKAEAKAEEKKAEAPAEEEAKSEEKKEEVKPAEKKQKSEPEKNKEKPEEKAKQEKSTGAAVSA